MDKKDIYEHLAKIYLDASSRKKKKSKSYPGFSKNLILAIAVFLFAGSSVLFINSRKDRNHNSETALILVNDAAKINFNFDPAKKETFTLNLNKLDMAKFKALAFMVKKVNPRDKIALRVEFSNSFKERSEIYFKDIPSKWQGYGINLADFRNITDWSEMNSLTFAVEEWNTKEKIGVVYIDNVRLLR